MERRARVERAVRGGREEEAKWERANGEEEDGACGGG